MIDFVIFLDENHCRNPHLIAVLEEAEVSYERHLDHFSAGAEDVVWLPEIAKKNWVLLTSDARIRRKSRVNYLELQAVRSNSLRMFYFSRNDSPGAKMGESLRRALPKMRKFCESLQPPFTASINKAGDVTLRDGFET